MNRNEPTLKGSCTWEANPRGVVLWQVGWLGGPQWTGACLPHHLQLVGAWVPGTTCTTTVANRSFRHSVLPPGIACHHTTLLLLHQPRAGSPEEGEGVEALTVVPLRHHWSDPQAPDSPLLPPTILA